MKGAVELLEKIREDAHSGRTTKKEGGRTPWTPKEKKHFFLSDENYQNLMNH